MLRCEVAARQSAAVSNPVVSNESVSNQNVSNPDYLRVKLWREANRERYNEKQREVMRRKRAAKA